MVLGILWVNSGTGQQSSSRDLTAPAGAARERPDIVARETVDYAAVAPQRRPLGAADADPNAPVLNPAAGVPGPERSEEHTSELQSLMRNSYAVFFWKKKKKEN